MKRLGLQPTRDTVWRIVKLIPDVDLTEAKLLRVSCRHMFKPVMTALTMTLTRVL
jgi:hypothetical protein